MNTTLLARLRELDIDTLLAKSGATVSPDILSEWKKADVRFTASDPKMEARFQQAVTELFSCIKPTLSDQPILHEGGIYFGCWIESTGSINAELLSRFLPSISAATYESFADHQADDGLFPYKLTPEGPGYFQIQIVTPFARCVWNQYLLNGRDKAFLRKMYEAMVRYDQWLAKYRDTLGTGGVEAFCCHDTGHDMSARFWHVPDSPHNNDPRTCNPDNPILPFVAPDLTANVACQRAYLAHIAEELGENGDVWRTKAEASLEALFTQCWDENDQFFYDRDRHGRLVKVQSDVLLRVLACEVGDDTFFAKALDRYLLNTRKFFPRFPFTSLAMDDPRFDQDFGHNTWCGPTNALSIIRAPHAFEAHHRYVELTWAMYPTLYALFEATEFPQCLSPYTGAQGFTRVYSPMILALLDFVERLCGVLPRPDGTVWFTGLIPYNIEQKQAPHETAYSRRVDGDVFELLNSPTETIALKNGIELFRAPKGVRVITDRNGAIRAIVGMSVQDIEGELRSPDGIFPFKVSANEQINLENGKWKSVRNGGYIPVSY